MSLLWKKAVFAENLRLTAPFFEKHRVRQPTYKEVLQNLLKDAFDFAFNKRGVSSSNRNTELKNPVLSQMQNGGLFLSAHYGNHELLGYKLAELGLPLNAANIEQRPKFFDNWIQKKRTYNGKSFADRKSPKEILQFIEGGGLFAFLADQDFRKPPPRCIVEKCKSEFLGVPVFCNPLPIFILEHRPNTKVFFGNIIGDFVQLSTFNSQLYNSYHLWLESVILQNPAKWYGWFHRRFASALRTVGGNSTSAFAPTP